ncbi:hypothetical protein LSAT2_015099, partial [Lamellibrachia satsuma]
RIYVSASTKPSTPWRTDVVSMSVRVYVAYTHTLIRHRSPTDQTKHAVAHRCRIYVSASVRSLYAYVDTTQIFDRPNQARRGAQ